MYRIVGVSLALVLALPALGFPDQPKEKPATPAQEYQSIMMEYKIARQAWQKAMQAWQKNYQEAKTAGETEDHRGVSTASAAGQVRPETPGACGEASQGPRGCGGSALGGQQRLRLWTA
jgi:hypothetical protein